MSDWGWAGIVHLDDGDRMAADACAKTRLRDAIRARDKFSEPSLDSHYWGALGEIAFARYLSVPWACASRVWSAPDVAGFEVRAIPPTTPRLYLKSKENDTAERIVLVAHLLNGTAALIVGWMYTADVQRLGDRRDPGRRGAPAWFIDDLGLLDRDFSEFRARST